MFTHGALMSELVIGLDEFHGIFLACRAIADASVILLHHTYYLSLAFVINPAYYQYPL